MPTNDALSTNRRAIQLARDFAAYCNQITEKDSHAVENETDWHQILGRIYGNDVCIRTHDAGIPQVLKYKFNCAEEVDVE